MFPFIIFLEGFILGLFAAVVGLVAIVTYGSKDGRLSGAFRALVAHVQSKHETNYRRLLQKQHANHSRQIENSNRNTSSTLIVTNALPVTLETVPPFKDSHDADRDSSELHPVPVPVALKVLGNTLVLSHGACSAPKMIASVAMKHTAVTKDPENRSVLYLTPLEDDDAEEGSNSGKSDSDREDSAAHPVGRRDRNGNLLLTARPHDWRLVRLTFSMPAEADRFWARFCSADSPLAAQWHTSLARWTGKDLSGGKQPDGIKQLDPSSYTLDAFNLLAQRIFIENYATEALSKKLRTKIAKKLTKLKLPKPLQGTLSLVSCVVGQALPFFKNAVLRPSDATSSAMRDDLASSSSTNSPPLRGTGPVGEFSFDVEMTYAGGFSLVLSADLVVGPLTLPAIIMTVTISELSGRLRVTINPPPSNSMWVGFDGPPDLKVSFSQEVVISKRNSLLERAVSHIPDLSEVVTELIKWKLFDDMILPYQDDFPVPNIEDTPPSSPLDFVDTDSFDTVDDADLLQDISSTDNRRPHNNIPETQNNNELVENTSLHSNSARSSGSFASDDDATESTPPPHLTSEEIRRERMLVQQALLRQRKKAETAQRHKEDPSVLRGEFGDYSGIGSDGHASDVHDRSHTRSPGKTERLRDTVREFRDRFFTKVAPASEDHRDHQDNNHRKSSASNASTVSTTRPLNDDESSLNEDPYEYMEQSSSISTTKKDMNTSKHEKEGDHHDKSGGRVRKRDIFFGVLKDKLSESAGKGQSSGAQTLKEKNNNRAQKYGNLAQK